MKWAERAAIQRLIRLQIEEAMIDAEIALLELDAKKALSDYEQIKQVRYLTWRMGRYDEDR